MDKTHPIMNAYGKTKWPGFNMGIHAEVHACLGVPVDDLQDASIYVCRVLKNGVEAMAKPCKVCQNFLRSVGIREVYFTTEDSSVGELKF